MQCPKSLRDKYHHRTQHSSYRTRNCRDLQIPRNNIEYVKKCFHYSAAKAWNDIPINIRELTALSRFKKQLKDIMRAEHNIKHDSLEGQLLLGYHWWTGRDAGLSEIILLSKSAII